MSWLGSLFGGSKAEEPPAAAAPAEPAPAAGAADAAAAAAAATAAAPQAAKTAEDAPKATSAEAPDAKAEAAKAAAKPKSSPKAKAAADPAAPKAGKKEKDAKGQGKPKGVRLVVKNLAEDMSQEQLKTLFAPCGNVLNTNVKTKEDGKCRGFAFITFETQQEADKAISDMHKKDIGGKELVVEIAESKVESKGADAKAKAKASAKGDSNQKGKGKGKKGAASPATAAHSPQEMQQMLANQQMYGAYGSNGAYTQYYAMQQQAAAAAAYQQAAFMQGLMLMQQQQLPAAQSWPSAAKQAGPLLQTAEYVGTVKSVSSKNGYGFIQCEDVRNDPVFTTFDYEKVARNPVLSRGKKASELKETAKTRDVYIAADILPEGGKESGSRVKFTMGLNEKGHPQAQACWLAR